MGLDDVMYHWMPTQPTAIEPNLVWSIRKLIILDVKGINYVDIINGNVQQVRQL